MEPVSITAIIISVIAALGTLLSRLRFRHCHMCCIDSDCIKTPSNTPPATPKIHETEEIYIYESTAV